MNPQILKVWDQAASLTAKLPAGPNSWQTEVNFVNMFVELIVRESIKVMMENDYHGEWLGQKIKEHFGIES